MMAKLEVKYPYLQARTLQRELLSHQTLSDPAAVPIASNRIIKISLLLMLTGNPRKHTYILLRVPSVFGLSF